MAIENNLQKICDSLLKNLPSRNRDVLAKRFGLNGQKNTLEAVGEYYGISRERVRQIEEDSLKTLRDKESREKELQRIFKSFARTIDSSGFLCREDLLLAKLGGERLQNQANFLLALGSKFKRFPETEEFWPFWHTSEKAPLLARKSITSFASLLKKEKEPMPLPSGIPASHIEVSKKVVKGPEGLYGLKKWPEVNPRGVKDKAYIVLKREKKPLHFTRVASSINDFFSDDNSKSVIIQTVHNELIKDPRFVLVGRGLYALKDWGYESGTVKDVIANVIKKEGRPVEKERLVREVLNRKKVKVNTILLNLQDKKRFLKNSEGKFIIRRA